MSYIPITPVEEVVSSTPTTADTGALDATTRLVYEQTRARELLEEILAVLMELKELVQVRS